MRMVILMFVLVCFSSKADAQAPSMKEMVYFRSEEHKFIFGYPKGWAPVPPTHVRTILKVLKNDGEGPEDCSVNVQPLPHNPSASPESYVKLAKANAPAYLDAMQRVSPDAKLVSMQETNLSNQAAWMTIATFTVKSVGIEVPMKVINVQTQRNDRVYTVGCRAPVANFQKTLPTFQSMFLGFLIK